MIHNNKGMESKCAHQYLNGENSVMTGFKCHNFCRFSSSIFDLYKRRKSFIFPDVFLSRDLTHSGFITVETL